MSIATTTSLKDIALSHPGAARVLEAFHLDYCCGGRDSLDEACRAAGLATAELLAAIEEASAATPAEPGLDQAPLNAVIQFIVGTHHAFTRTELARIEPLLGKVIARHGAAHPELAAIGEGFRALQGDLGPHLDKEERILFPYIHGLESWRAGHGAQPEACFGSMDNPLRQMQAEHENVGALLKKIRRLSRHFMPPDDACPSYRALYQALEGLETDLMRHIHLENNVLFPRARALEGAP